MAESYTVEAKFIADIDNYTRGIQAATRQMQRFERQASAGGVNIQKSLSSVGNVMKVAGVATTALGISAVKSFGEFDQSLNSAAVIAGGTSKDISGLSDVALKMGQDLPLSANDAANAMVEMARNGASVEDLKKVFPAVAMASTAAGADLTATAGVVQQSMNIWGGSLKTPQRAAAYLTQAANLSNASIESMQQALATMGPAAQAAGWDMRDTSTAIGLLINTGMSSAQAADDLRHALIMMQSPSNKAADAASQLGISFRDSQGNMKPLPKIADELNGKLSGLSFSTQDMALKAMFGTAGMQAMRTIMSSASDTTGNAKTNWDAFSKAMDQAGGSTKTATAYLKDQANEMQNNVGAKIEQVGGAWDSYSKKSMEGAKATHSQIFGMTADMLDWAANSNSSFAQVARGFMGFSTVIGPSMAGLGAFLTNLTRITAFSKSVGGAVVRMGAMVGGSVVNFVKTGIAIKRVASGASGARAALSTFAKTSKIAAAAQWAMNSALLANPLTWVVVAIVALVAGIALWITKTKSGQKAWQTFTGWLKGVWSGMVSFFQGVWAGISESVNTAVQFFNQTWQGTVTFFKSLWTGIVNFFQGLWTEITTVVSSVISVITSLWQGFVAIIMPIWQNLVTTFQPIWTAITQIVQTVVTTITFLWQNTVTTLQAIWQGIVTIAQGVWSLLKNVILGPILVLIQLLTGNWSGAMSSLSQIWNNIKNAAAQIWSGIKQVVSSLVSGAVKFVQTIWSSGKAILSSIWNGIKGTAVNLWNRITSTISNAVKAAVNLVKSTWNGGKAFISSIWNGIKSLASSVWNGIKATISSLAQSAVNGLRSAWSGMIGFARGIFNGVRNTIRTALNINLYSIGSNIISGLWNGMIGVAKGLLNWVNNLANSIISKIKHALSIHSPSRKMKEIGSFTGEGMLIGLQDQIRPITQVAAKIADAVMIEPQSSNMEYHLTPIADGIGSLNDGSLSMTLDGQAPQPALISLELGGDAYNTFVDNIQNRGGQRAQLKKGNSFR